ncbi:1-phosphofructokinase [Caloramator sp. E03]|uniref:1-phosphofructokinase n=1 Tax=Caloramator sp. E03 TaxID=2576307 RepID=UPI001110341C|nr:1-phosphofructokinase [Caloramator sp. E03]QCX34407.1 1-phosphofructokinase [Caloramator sp. E03]
MIFTVTLNPAVDKTLRIPNFSVGQVNRVESLRVDAGGKGINVSKTVKELKGESTAFGFIGGKSGEYIKEYLDAIGIKNDFLWINSDIRTNIKIVDTINNTFTDINEAGPTVSQKDLEKIMKKILDAAYENSVLVLSGSIPNGLGSSTYKDIIEYVSPKNVKVILDAEGELFTEGIKASPYLVKPNKYELEKAFNIKIDNDLVLIEVCRKVIAMGVKYVVVSLGENGSVMVSKDKVLKAKGLKVDVKSTVGAGDSMVAALALSIERNYEMDYALRFAAATSTANVMTEGTQTAEYEVINELINKIEIVEINM